MSDSCGWGLSIGNLMSLQTERQPYSVNEHMNAMQLVARKRNLKRGQKTRDHLVYVLQTYGDLPSDKIAVKMGKSRGRVNQVCARLERDGILRRMGGRQQTIWTLKGN